MSRIGILLTISTQKLSHILLSKNRNFSHVTAKFQSSLLPLHDFFLPAWHAIFLLTAINRALK